MVITVPMYGWRIYTKELQRALAVGLTQQYRKDW